MLGRGFRRLGSVAAVAALVIGLAACGGSDEPAATSGQTTTTERAEIGPSRAADQIACVTSARAIESAAALNYAKSGSYGTIDDLVTAGYIESAPDPSSGLTIRPDGTVDTSHCP